MLHYAILSTGEKVENPKHLLNAQRRLAVPQRQLARKQEGSKNRNKARLKVARCHQKIADHRQDFQHQLSSRLVRENQALAVELLNVEGMMKNPWLTGARPGGGCSSRFRPDWCQEVGKTLLRSRSSSPPRRPVRSLGSRKADLTLTGREWICPNCGTTRALIFPVQIIGNS